MHLPFSLVSSRPSTHQLALESADANFIRSLSPIRVASEKRIEHIHTSVFGGRRSPVVPTGPDNDWCKKGLVIAGESCSPALERLSSPMHFTKSYSTRRALPNAVEINERPAFPGTRREYLDSIKIRKVLAEERGNPEGTHLATALS